MGNLVAKMLYVFLASVLGVGSLSAVIDASTVAIYGTGDTSEANDRRVWQFIDGWITGNVPGVLNQALAPTSKGNSGPSLVPADNFLSLNTDNGNDGAYPWVAYGQRYSTTLTASPVTFHHRVENKGEMALTSQMGPFFRLLSEGRSEGQPKEFILGVHQRSETYETLDVDVPIDVGLKRMHMIWRMSFVAPRHLQTFTATGYGTAGAGEAPSFHLQYKSQEADVGLGWAMGGRVTYETSSLIWTLDAWDAVGHVVWPSAVVRTGIANSRTQVVGHDGHVSFAPLIRGVVTQEAVTTQPSPRWTAQVAPVRPRRFAGMTVEWQGSRYLSVMTHFTLNADTVFTVGITAPSSAFTLGLHHKTWYFGLSTSYVLSGEGHTTALRIGKRW